MSAELLELVCIDFEYGLIFDSIDAVNPSENYSFFFRRRAAMGANGNAACVIAASGMLPLPSQAGRKNL